LLTSKSDTLLQNLKAAEKYENDDDR
jgi:hypothetical protein